MIRRRSNQSSVTRGYLGLIPRCCLWGVCALFAYSWSGFAALSPTVAQDEKLEDVTSTGASSTPVSGAERSAGNKKKSGGEKMPTMLDMFWASGAIGMVIVLLSMVALGFTIEHLMSIREVKLIPEYVVQELGELIAHGKIDDAMEFCDQPENESLVADVVLAGLQRYKGSEFGFAEYKSAVEEAGEDCTSRLYRKTEVLSVIAAIAPMLGLLGTVQGMILAFNTISAKGGMARPDELAGSISLALVTTFEGLVVAIPAMVAFSYFRNRIDSLVAEAGKRVEQIMLPLARRKFS